MNLVESLYGQIDRVEEIINQPYNRNVNTPAMEMMGNDLQSAKIAVEDGEAGEMRRALARLMAWD
jgi:hypothetical protein